MESHVDLGPEVLISDRYRLVETLARGGTSSVWRAHDERLERDVALKILRDDDVDPALRARAEREAMVLAELSHQNVVRVLDRGVDDDGRPYLVMDLLDGEPLSQVIAQRGPLPVDDAAELVAAIADGLGEAHRRGVIHRDVKPSNIVCVGDVPVLVDFGIARSIDGTTLTRGLVLGTAAYLAPEQAQGQSLTPAADVYGLGCVLYELLTGRPPFDGTSPVAIAMRHVQDEPAPPSSLADVPQAIDDVVLRCLAKDPGRRPADGIALAAALRASTERGDADETAAIAEPAVRNTAVLPPVVTEAEVADRSRLGPAAIVAVIVGLVAALVVFLLTRDDDTRAVPDVTNAPVDDATMFLENAGLAYDVTNVDGDAPAGIVVRSDPAPGDEVGDDETIELFVSTGEGAPSAATTTVAPPSDGGGDDDDDGDDGAGRVEGRGNGRGNGKRD